MERDLISGSTPAETRKDTIATRVHSINNLTLAMLGRTLWV